MVHALLNVYLSYRGNVLVLSGSLSVEKVRKVPLTVS